VPEARGPQFNLQHHQKRREREKRENICQHRILYLRKIFCRNEDKIKAFLNTEQFIEFVTSRIIQKEILKNVLKAKEK
jgi:hypothetical protein